MSRGTSVPGLNGSSTRLGVIRVMIASSPLSSLTKAPTTLFCPRSAITRLSTRISSRAANWTSAVGIPSASNVKRDVGSPCSSSNDSIFCTRPCWTTKRSSSSLRTMVFILACDALSSQVVMRSVSLMFVILTNWLRPVVGSAMRIPLRKYSTTVLAASLPSSVVCNHALMAV